MSNEESASPDIEQSVKKRKGFASMSLERRQEIARMGGKAAQASGSGHRFTSDEARSAGQKGGASVSRDRAHMSEIGRKGGLIAKEKASRAEP